MNLQILKDIARELDSLDVTEATPVEKNIATLLINAGLLTVEPMHAEALGSFPATNWEEYRKKD